MMISSDERSATQRYAAKDHSDCPRLLTWLAHQRTTPRWPGDDTDRATAVEAAPCDLCQGGRSDTMGTVLELSEKTYHQLADLAQRQQQTVEEMLRLCLAAYEEALYERAHQQMLADGVLVSMPAPPLRPGETEEEDVEPVELPGKPLSEIILEERR